MDVLSIHLNAFSGIREVLYVTSGVAARRFCPIVHFYLRHSSCRDELQKSPKPGQFLCKRLVRVGGHALFTSLQRVLILKERPISIDSWLSPDKICQEITIT